MAWYTSKLETQITVQLIYHHIHIKQFVKIDQQQSLNKQLPANALQLFN